MKKATANAALLALFLASVLAGVLVYPRLPEKIASHWNNAGEADGYSGRFWGVFLLPVVMAALFVLKLVILKVEPLKENVAAFRKYFDAFWIFLFGFLFYMFSLMIGWNVVYRFNFATAMVPAIAALFYMLGHILPKTKPNWFMGIRTPWTLSSETVWEKTHVLGGKLFKIAAAASLLGMFFRGPIAFVFSLIAPILFATIVTVVYSYTEFKKTTGS